MIRGLDHPLNALKRRIALVLLPVGTVAVLLARLVQIRQGAPEPLDAWALPLMGVSFLVLTLILWLRPESLSFTQGAGYVVLAGYALLSLEYQFRVYLPVNHGLSEATYWFSLLYLIAFANWKLRVAVWVSITTFVAMLLLGFWRGLPVLIANGVDPDAIGFVLQFYISSLAYIAFIFSFATIRQQYYRMHHLAHADSLTGLPNRRAGEELINYEIERVERYKHDFSVVVFDLDHFKRVNDNHGHDVGDGVLRELAKRVEGYLRKADRLIRWGGEEFVILLPETSPEEACHITERIRKAVNAEPFKGPGWLSASFGIASYQPDDTLTLMIKRADQSLYGAKQNGRNCVVIGDFNVSSGHNLSERLA